jgi:hypothetical protein
MEFAKPPGQDAATMRISMLTELTGEFVKLGKSPAESHLFVDGTQFTCFTGAKVQMLT